MPNVIIKGDDRRSKTQAVLNAYGVGKTATPVQREAAEHIARRSEEAYKQLRRKS